MRVGIVGSRRYENKKKIKDFIFKLKQEHGEDTIIVSGGCKNGADKYAKKYEELMRYLIKKNKISVIYVVNSLDSRKIFHYVDLYKHCPQKIYIPKKLKSYDLENCS